MNDAKQIGLDVHQATISAVVLDSSGRLVIESIREPKAATILQCVHGLRGRLQVTFDEAISAAWRHDLLKPQVTKLLVCDPRKNALLKSGNKNDRVDARKLADLLRTGLGLLPSAGDEEAHTSGQRQRSEDRRERDGMFRLRGGVNWPKIKHSFPTRVRNALIGEGQCAQNDQQEPGERNRFHVLHLVVKTDARSTARNMPSFCRHFKVMPAETGKSQPPPVRKTLEIELKTDYVVNAIVPVNQTRMPADQYVTIAAWWGWQTTIVIGRYRVDFPEHVSIVRTAAEGRLCPH